MWDAVWVIAPVLGALFLHAPVLRFDLFRSLARPMDGLNTVRGRRLFGPNKTWRGALAMWLGAAGGVLVLAQVPSFAKLWPESLRDHPFAYGALLGLGFVGGELPNSFLKRQLDIEAGKQRRSLLGLVLSIYDQADFVPGIWLTLSPLRVMSLTQALVAFGVATLIHMLANVLGYLIGARKSWI